MKKMQLSRLMMVATILLLAVFEGYWLNKLYHDEYSNLQKEVDVNFRDAMYKLQRRRFEKDTNLVDKNLPAAFPVNTRDIMEGNSKSSAIIYSSGPPEDAVNNRMPGKMAMVKRKSDVYEYHGVPPPGLIEVILRQKPGNHDTGKAFIKIDSSFTVDPAKSDQLKKVSSTLTFRINNKNDGRLIRGYYDSVLEAANVNAPMPASGNRRGKMIRSFHQGAGSQRGSAGSFNKVFIEMNDHKSRETSPMIRFLATNKTLNDSIPVSVVDSAYREELVKNNRRLPYSILFKKYTDDNMRRAEFEKDSTEAVITSKVFVGYNTPYSYQAIFSNTGPFILKKMGVQIGGSVILLLFVLVSFITLYRNLVAQQRLTIIKNDFISNITHELKTPIATVNVAIEALRNFGGLQSPERTREYLDISASELQRLSLLVDKVLKLSMFEKQEISLQKEPFDLQQLVEEVMSSMRLQFEKQKAVARFESAGQDFIIEADRLHITSVIYNLLDNALKYSNDAPEITIRLSRQAEYFELQVNDNGIGIPEAYRFKVFEQFFRVPNGNRHDIKGYGLGLSYVNHIVKQHHGFIEVVSELDRGSSFIIKMPFAETSAVHYDNGRVIKKEKFL